MAITPILNSNIEAVISEQLNSKYDQVELVAKNINDVVTLANELGTGVDFSVLAAALQNLTTLSAQTLADLSTANLIEITQDLAKGNYLGNRKIDIDLSKLIGEDGVAPKFEQVNIVTQDGVTIEWPFYAPGTTVVNETESPSVILQHIKDAIMDYNANEPDEFKHVVNVEYELLNETIVDKPTIVRLYDTDGKTATFLRIELLHYISKNVEEYYWAQTTSSLEVLSNRVSELISIGAQINSIVSLASKIDELLLLQSNLGGLTVNTDSLYSNIDKLESLYAEISNFTVLYNDVKAGGTNYTTTVATDLQDASSKIKTLADDIQLGSTNSILLQIANSLNMLTTVYNNITNSNVSKIVTVVDDGSVAKIVSNIDAGNIAKVVTEVDNGNVTKLVDNIDNGNIDKVVSKIDNNALQTVADKEAEIQTVVDNLTEVLASLTNAQNAAASAQQAQTAADTATAQANSIHTLGADALTLTAGSAASVSYDSNGNKLILGIPQGPKGDRGDAFNVNATGTLAERDNFDGQPKDFSFLATDTGELYIKRSDTSGDWSNAIPFGKGDKGDTGPGIASVTFYTTTDPSGTAGKLNATDTYKVLLDNGDLSYFKVTNGTGKTVINANSDITVDTTSLVLCDSTATTQQDTLTSIVAENGSTYEVSIDGESAAYTSDAYVNQTFTVNNITVAHDSDYTISVNSTDATYHSDPLVAQVSDAEVQSVQSSHNYEFGIDNTTISYVSSDDVAQQNNIDSITVEDSTSYKVSINGNEVAYVSDAAVAQIDKITSITAADSALYSIIIAGTEVSYTSDDDATVDEIRDGLVDAINNDSDTSAVVTASADNMDVKIEGNTAGEAFTSSVSNGDMEVSTTVEADKATEAEITQGLVDAINNDSNTSADVTASVVSSGVVLVEADVAGVAFTLDIVSGQMSTAIVRANNTATLDEILSGLKDAVNNSSVPVVATIVDSKVKLTGSNAGDPFSTTDSDDVVITLITAAEKAELGEITAGLVDAINALSEPVTAVDKTTYLTISSDDHDQDQTVTISAGDMDITEHSADEATLAEIVLGMTDAINNLGNSKLTATNENNEVTITAETAGVGYDISLVKGNMSLTSVVANQPGCRNITLPSNPEDGIIVQIVDDKGDFATDNVVMHRNGALIHGNADDLVLDVDNMHIELVCVDNDWRFE